MSVENILEWRESLTTLPDHHFFEIIRMYLGEIKTPYNKQKLIEELSSFLRKEATKKAIVQLLSEDDLRILSAVQVIPLATQEKLSAFFKDEYQYSELYERLMNLEERLLVYRHVHPANRRTVFSINPLLEETLKPYIGRSRLLRAEELTERGEGQGAPCLTPGLLAAFIPFVADNTDLKKADGSFKKRVNQALPLIFPRYAEGNYLRLLLEACINLGLFRQTDSGLVVMWPRIRQFARQREAVQYAYLVAASAGHFPRDILQKQAQLILDILYSIPETGYSRKMLIQDAFLLQEKNQPDNALNGFSSRMAAILRDSDDQPPLSTADTVALLITNAIALGLFQPVGRDRNGDEAYVPAEGLVIPASEGAVRAGEGRRLASIDSGSSATLLPGMTLEEMLSFSVCSEPVRYDTILQLDITKKAAIRCFDEGLEPELILGDMQRSLSHELPQSLVFSFNDWYSGYNSAAIFKGYVLRIVPEKAVLVEKNPEFAPYIRMTLAPGVFLLDFAGDEEARQVIANSGLDFIGSVRDAHKTTESVPFAPVRLPMTHDQRKDDTVCLDPSQEGRDELLEGLRAALSGIKMNEEQQEELKARIERRIIVSPVQLRPDSVRPEKNEASGMDFLGKIHVAELAIQSDSLLEITYDGTVYLGKPLGIDKHQGDSTLRVEIQPERQVREFSVGRAQVIKRIRGAIFKNPRIKVQC